MLPPVGALLLDFGGVIADGIEDPRWLPAMARAVVQALAEADAPAVPLETVVAALAADDQRPDRFWHDHAPVQASHASFWADDIGAGWPAAARAALAARGEQLSRRLMESRHGPTWQLRAGIREVLADAAARDIPVAVVSNTVSGAAHRGFLDREGLVDGFAAQLYSDEEGVRKPNPEIALRAAAAVGVPAPRCWFVGDTLTRDVLVARRAGLGAAVLMRSLRAEPAQPPDGVRPDAVVADPVELRALLAAHW